MSRGYQVSETLRGIVGQYGEDVTIDAYRIDNDVNGNPRYVVHYLWFSRTEYVSDSCKISTGSESYDEVVARMNKRFGVKRYRARWFGGGLVFQSYNLRHDLEMFYAATYPHSATV